MESILHLTEERFPESEAESEIRRYDQFQTAVSDFRGVIFAPVTFC